MEHLGPQNWRSDSQHADFTYEGVTIRVYLVVVTPALAKLWLARNEHNRPETNTALVRLARAIVQDEWQLNGATIVFDANGLLLDGQHRLIACVRSDTPIVSLVAEGVSLEAQATMDTGGAGNRNLAQNLGMPPNPEKSANQLAAALNVVYRIRNGGMKRQSTTYPSVTEGLALLQKDPRLRESLPIGKRANRPPLKMPAGLGAALHYLFSEVDGEAADTFFELLLTGAKLEERHPIFVLRKKLMDRGAQNHDKARAEVVGAWIIKSWNWWLEGRSVSRVYWTPGGPKGERFPTISAPEGYGDDGGAA